MTRYQHLANLLAERIEQGLYRHGEKLPSVRSLSQEHGVSISTVQQAYQTLEQLDNPVGSGAGHACRSCRQIDNPF